MVRVSIIIAVYNIENYIKRCLKSCMNQSFRDIEIIVVNDGSTDKTLNIINECKKIDNRIKVIDKKNEGLIEARKSGFNIAKGEYILFVDGDDWIKLNTIEVLYKNAKEKEYDIICYKYLLKYEDNTEKNGWDTPIESVADNSLLNLLFNNKITHTIWSKFIKKAFILDNNIEFPKDISYGEDLAFVYTLAMYNPLFTIIDENLYYYYQRQGSLDNGISLKVCEITKAIIFIKEQLIKNNLYEEHREEFEYMAYMQSYYIRQKYIFKNNDNTSKLLHKNWRNLNICINSKNNKFYRDMYKQDSKKALLVEAICKRSYFLGSIYYRLKID